jgi:hypothetical protein
LFKLTANTAYRCSCAWPHRGPLGVAPGGCPGPMRRSWLRRNRLTKALPQFPHPGAGGLSVFRPPKQKACISLVKLPSGGPGLLNARPALWPGVLNCFPALRDTAGAYTSEYPIPLIHVAMHLGSGPIRQISMGTTVRRSEENNVTRYSMDLRASPATRRSRVLGNRFCLPFCSCARSVVSRGRPP